MINLRYNNGRINSAETPFKIPDTWMWVKLGDISSITTGAKDANEGDVDGEYDFFTCALIPIKSKVYSFSGEYLILPGNGANVGKCIHYIGKFEAYQRTYVVQCYNVFMKYIYWVIEAKWAKYNQDKLFGSAIPYIKLSNLEEFPIPLPPLAEQKRIVEKIEELEPLVNRYGKAAKELARIKSAFPEDLRNSILQQAIEGKLVPQNPTDEPASELLKQIKQERQQQVKEGKIKPSKLPKSNEPLNPADMPFKIPDSWVWTSLSEIGLINPRNVIEDNLEVSFIPMDKISSKYNVPVNVNEKKLWKNVKSGYTHLKDGDVIMAKITPCFENKKSSVLHNLLNGYGAGTTELHVFRGININPYYVLIYLKSPFFMKYASNNMTGTAGQQRVPSDIFATYPFPMPPYNEQEKIVKKIEELMDSSNKLEQIINQSI